MSDGYYLMHRGWMQNPVFKEEPFTEREAWEWMISQANYKEGEINVKNKKTKLRRGEFSHSVRFMAKAWDWDKGRVERFITRLIDWAMIETRNETGQNIIKLSNYNDFQDFKKVIRDRERDNPETTPRQRQKQIKTNKNKNNKDSYWFEGEVIKLTEKDYKNLLDRAKTNDQRFWKWLSDRDSWYVREGNSNSDNWFYPTTKAIDKQFGTSS